MNIDKTVIYDKKLGESSLDAVRRFKKENNLESEKVAYAGRLDPMAEGQLLLMIGQACKRRDLYQLHDKVYEFEMILGFNSDSYDLLGLPEFNEVLMNSVEQVVRILPNLQGKLKQPYPPYSSFHVNGKPLFAWAREGKLSDIEIPSKEVEVKELALIDHRTISGSELLEDIINRLQLVKGNFRQDQIIQRWQAVFESNKLESHKFTIYKLKAHVSSGTYIRSLVNEIGKLLQTRAITYSIKRSAIYQS